MEPIISLNPHHVAFLKRFAQSTSPAEAVADNIIYNSARFKTGTIAEQKNWTKLNMEAAVAVAERSFRLIAEAIPDHICSGCLDLTCGKSEVVRQNDRLAERQAAYDLTMADLKRTFGTAIIDPFTQHEFVSRTMGLHMEGK